LLIFGDIYKLAFLKQSVDTKILFQITTVRVYMLLYFNAVNLWLYRLLTVIATALYESAGRGKCPTKFGQYSGEDSAKQERNSDRKKPKIATKSTSSAI